MSRRSTPSEPQELNALLDETLALVQAHLPEVDLTQPKREVFRRRHRQRVPLPPPESERQLAGSDVRRRQAMQRPARGDWLPVSALVAPGRRQRG